MSPQRYGVLLNPDADFDTLAWRARHVEELGFDLVYVADHSGDYRHPGGPWYDGWTSLTVIAQATERIRIGTLVSNPILRPPALLAREAHALDHLSGGRLELGIGAGIAGFDHEAAGIDYWEPAERVARFAEYVAVVDGLLRGPSRGFRFDGAYHRTGGMTLVPPAVQRPRPPITVGGQARGVRRAAMRFAECWNTHGPFGPGMAALAEITARQNAEMDDWCREAGRDPASLRRSLLLFAALDPWHAAVTATDVIARFSDAGIAEFVLFWPGDDRVGELDALASHLRAPASTI